jgi:hypothetical protein
MLVIRQYCAQNPVPVVAQKAQPSGGLVKIWPGEITRPFFFVGDFVGDFVDDKNPDAGAR